MSTPVPTWGERPARVRVGVVSYRTPDLLTVSLQAVAAAAPGLDVEVVVVDNCSGDGSAAAARAVPGVTVVESPENLGYARAMNIALDAPDADVLVALNPDAVLPAGGLARLVADLRDEPDVGLVSPRLLGADGALQHSVHRFPSPGQALVTGLVPPAARGGRWASRFHLEGHAALDRREDVDWTVGAVHVIRRTALAGEAPYSTRSFMYAEDLEVCWRLRRRGWRVLFDPAVEVVHVGNAAGEAAFGDARERRWLDATYDWYVHDRGLAAARAWAGANVVGLAAKWAVLAATGEAGHRVAVADLLAFHAARVRQPLGDQHSRRAPVAAVAGARAPDVGAAS